MTVSALSSLTMSSSSERSSSPEDYTPGANTGANTPVKGSWATGKKIVRAPGVDPKVFGHIPGVPVGATFKDRWDCSQAGVHGPLRGGIAGGGEVGAYSVVLSGGYEDDEDLGETILYTGQGGRSTGTKLDIMQGKESWDGEQVKDQEWTRGNKALKLSCKNEKPVRVVRGHTLKSRFAPVEGYRYDGLYKVVEGWRAAGKSGFMTCRFRFRRLPNQPSLPGSQQGRNNGPVASTSRITAEPKQYTAPPNTQPSVVIKPKVPLMPGPASAKPLLKPGPASAKAPSIPATTSTLKPGPFSAGQRRQEPSIASARPRDSPMMPEVTIPATTFSLSALFGDRDPRLGAARPGPSQRPSGPPSFKPPVVAPSSQQPPLRARLRSLPVAVRPPQKRHHDKDPQIEDGELTGSEDVKLVTAKRRRTDSPDLPQLDITLED